LSAAAHQTDIAFLNQVEQVQAAIDVFLGDRNDQPEIGFDQVFLGALGFDFAMTNHGGGVAQIGKVAPAVCSRLRISRLISRALACAVWLDLDSDFAQVGIEMRKLLDHAFDFLAELFPLRQVEGDFADRLRDLDAGPRASLPDHLRRSFLLDSAIELSLSESWVSFL